MVFNSSSTCSKYKQILHYQFSVTPATYTHTLTHTYTSVGLKTYTALNNNTHTHKIGCNGETKSVCVVISFFLDLCTLFIFLVELFCLLLCPLLLFSLQFERPVEIDLGPNMHWNRTKSIREKHFHLYTEHSWWINTKHTNCFAIHIHYYYD